MSNHARHIRKFTQPEPRGRVPTTTGGGATKDARIVYGSRCMWWDTIYNVAPGPPPHHLPVCPGCGCVLYEVPNMAAWLHNADKHGEDYVNMLKWCQGKHYVTMDELKEAWENHKSE